MIWLLVATLWFVGWMISWPAVLAYFQGKYPNLADEDYREDLAFAMGFSLIPVFWLMIPFTTGFYEYGFQICRRVK